MTMRKVAALGSILALALVGVWLMSLARQPAPESALRFGALSALAPPGAASGAMTDAGPLAATVTLAAASPVAVDLATVAIPAENPDSMLAQWLAGAIDLEWEGLRDDATLARLRAESAAAGPTPGVQTDGPGVGSGALRSGLAGGVVEFDSVDFTQSGGTVPPDPMMAAGPNHLLVAVNVAFAIHNKNGTLAFGPAPASTLLGVHPSCNSGLFDPNVVYDEEARRWIVLYDKGAFTSTGGLCLAASQTSDPTGSWWVYFFNVNSAAAWVDFPHTGVGDSFIFVGGNMFNQVPPPNTSYVEARIWALNKASLYSGAAVTPVQRGLGAAIDTPQPLNLHGVANYTWPPLGNKHYFLGELFDGRNYPLLEWNPVSGAFANRGNMDLGVGGFPVNAVQSGGGTITANDWRPLDFEYRNGYGWTSMTIGCNPGAGTVNCVRWAQIDLANAAIGPEGVGVLGTNGVHRYFPDVAVDHCNNMLAGYTRSSSSTFPSIDEALHLGSSGPGVTDLNLQRKAGAINYVAFDGQPRRWGDYTGMTMDPDGFTFWYVGEYSKNTGTTNGRWGTFVVSEGVTTCQGYATFIPSIARPAP